MPEIQLQTVFYLGYSKLLHGMGLYVKPMEGQELLSFLFGGGRKSYALFYKCIFRRDFLSPAYCNSLGYRKLSQRLHVLLLWWSGIVVTALRLLKSVVREYISPRIHCRLYSWQNELQWHTNIWNEIPEHTFTITRTDNIDKLQSYSAVYCCDQQCSLSWHNSTAWPAKTKLQLSRPVSSPNPYWLSRICSSTPNPIPNRTPNPISFDAQAKYISLGL